MRSPALTLEGFDDSIGTVTDKSLIAAQGTTKHISVYQLYISAKQATKVTFESGSGTKKHVQYVAAGGGSVLPFTGVPWFTCGLNKALTYTTDTAGGCTVRVRAAVV